MQLVTETPKLDHHLTLCIKSCPNFLMNRWKHFVHHLAKTGGRKKEKKPNQLHSSLSISLTEIPHGSFPGLELHSYLRHPSPCCWHTASCFSHPGCTTSPLANPCHSCPSCALDTNFHILKLKSQVSPHNTRLSAGRDTGLGLFSKFLSASPCLLAHKHQVSLSLSPGISEGFELLFSPYILRLKSALALLTWSTQLPKKGLIYAAFSPFLLFSFSTCWFTA